jgi:hypothetical protein
MPRGARLRRGPAPSANGSRAPSPGDKPSTGDEYLAWLDEMWHGDSRELREGRYLHQQGDLRQAFETSPYWREISARLYDWAHAYTKKTDALLFQGVPQAPALASKPWQSFLSRTWRENVHHNENWPDPPKDGWWLPDNWFERAWDIVRTRFVVRYMDGVTTLADHLRDCADERRFKLEAILKPHAKEDGYYAFHVLVRQSFDVAALDYDAKLTRSSVVEIQVMTSLAEVIGELTHAYYEVRREAMPDDIPAVWRDYDSDEIRAADLGRDSISVEREVMRLRNMIRSQAGARAADQRGRR